MINLRKCMFTCMSCLLTLNCYASEIKNSGVENTPLKIGTMKLPPYGWIDNQGVKHGVIYDMNEEIGLRSGLKYENQILPFARMLEKLKTGELDLVSSLAHKPALEAGEQLAIQHTVTVIVVTRKGSNIQTINDLKGKHLVYIRSASYPQLEGIPNRISRVDNYRQSVLLLKKRPVVDGAVFTEPAYYYWVKTLGFKPNDFGTVIPIEKGKKQWIFVKKNLSVKRKKILKSVTDEIYKENMYEKLLIKYGKQ